MKARHREMLLTAWGFFLAFIFGVKGAEMVVRWWRRWRAARGARWQNVTCGTCLARPTWPCTDAVGNPVVPHVEREAAK